jgi:hypothetical protein
LSHLLEVALVVQVVDVLLVLLSLALEILDAGLESLEVVLTHGITASVILESDAALAAEGSLPVPPSLLGSGVELLVGLKNGLPAAANMGGVLLHGSSAGLAAALELVDVTARLGDGVDEGVHVGLLGAAHVHRVEHGILHVGISLLGLIDSGRLLLLLCGGLLLFLGDLLCDSPTISCQILCTGSPKHG